MRQPAAPHLQPGSGEESKFVLSPLSPFYSAQTPSPQDGAITFRFVHLNRPVNPIKKFLLWFAQRFVS